MEQITENTSPLIEKAKIGDLLQYLKETFNISEELMAEIEQVNDIYPLKVNSYYLHLIERVGDPIWKQCIPSIEELMDQTGEEDPLAEERDSPVPLITHRYPDRVLFLISDTCEMYCRFCTRKRKVGTERLHITYEKLENAINYIDAHPEVRDVILSGGDALCVSLERLEYILSRIRQIEHVEIIRLGTRLPCTNPSRITPELCNMLKKYHPLYINVHFEHPAEITAQARNACALLADAGIPLGNQNVLLAGINDNVETMGKLWKDLLKIRVKPYYLFQADYVKGTNHFRTSVQIGKDIIYGVRGWVSGLAIPHYVIDAPDGGGKIPILPDQYLQHIDDEKVTMMNYKGKICEYPQK
jgi:lysine 2,3-aminomutase